MNEIKNKLLKLAAEKENDLIDLCSNLIKAKSVNPNGDIYSAINVIKEYLDKSNIEYELIDRNSKEFPIIIARVGEKKENGKTIFLNGHCDVVPIGDIEKWNFDPFSGEIKDGKMLGRGTSDMKCGLGGLMFMMKVLKENEAKLNGEIVLHIVSDEETGGEFGTKWLYENNYFEDGAACIIAEPTSSNNCEVGQKGSLWFKFKSYGIPAHGSIGNYVGENAITKLLKLLNRLEDFRTIEGKYEEKQLPVLEDSKKIARESLKVEGVDNVIDHVTVNIGTINGGTNTNSVPDYCEASVDMRIPIGIKLPFMLDKLKSLINELGLKGIEYDYTWNSEANYTDVDTELVKAVVRNADYIWNAKTIPAYQWASSDARYYRLKNIPTIQYGPANTEGIHSYNEDVDVIDIVNCSKVYITMMVDLLDITL